MTDFKAATPSVTQIENDIRETRARVDDEIGAISDKLSPAHMKRRAKQAVRRKGHNMLRTVKDNPIPSAIAALGLAWLIKARKNTDAAGSSENVSANVSETVKEQAHEIAGTASDTAKRTGRSLQDFFESNPIIAGAGALVLGAAVGALIPETEKENQLQQKLSERTPNT
jgi:hypothetical protein